MKLHIYKLLVVLVWTCIYNTSYCQPSVSNIRIETDANKVKVVYDLESISKEDSLYLQIEGRSRGPLNVKTVSGDLGKNLTSGKEKVILWDYALDGEQLNEEIRPIIKVIESNPTSLAGGGPANAFVSLLAPGVGNIFVQPNHRIGLRPLITVAYGGLLGYSLVQKSKSNKQYNLYLKERYERDALPYYNKANRYHHEYIVTMSMAATILAVDVVYTYLKGLRNNQHKRNSKQSVMLQYIEKTPLIGLKYTF